MKQISKEKFLCAEGEEEWQGKFANCSRKAGRKCNARFQANRKFNYCSKAKKHWIKLFAVGTMNPGDEVLPDYNADFWMEADGKGSESLPTPESNYKPHYDVASELSWEPTQDEKEKKKGEGRRRE